MVKQYFIFIFFLIGTVAYTQNDPILFELDIKIQQPNIDSYSEFLDIMEINELGNTDRLISRSEKTHILDSIVSVSIYDDFFLRTDFIWEQEKLTEFYFKKFFQTKEWIPSGCSEFGLNRNDQITYHHSMTCEGAAPTLSDEYFYDQENRLERHEWFQTLSVSGVPIHRGIIYDYDENGLLFRSESYDIVLNNREVDGYLEYNYDSDGKLVSWVRYSIEGQDTFFRKTDSLSISFTSQGRLDSVSTYYFGSTGMVVPSSVRDLDYDIDGLLIKEVHKDNYNSVQGEYDDIELIELNYDTEDNLKELYITPSRKNGSNLSNDQIYDQLEFSLYTYDTSVNLEDIFYLRDFLEPRPFRDSLNSRRLFRNLRKDMLKKREFYLGNVLTFSVDYHYSPLSSFTKEIELEKVSVFPNPTTDVVTITYPSHSISQIFLYDISGQLIKSCENGICSLADLMPGIYIAEVWISGVGRVVKRIVRQ